jgi:hypothetical protein
MATDKNPIQIVEDHPLEAFDLLKQIQNSQPQTAFDNDGMMPDDDKVNHPSHYTWLKDLCCIEVIDITRHMDFDLGNAIKYLLRQGKKSEKGISDRDKAIEDLRKAIFYINDKIKMLATK